MVDTVEESKRKQAVRNHARYLRKKDEILGKHKIYASARSAEIREVWRRYMYGLPAGRYDELLSEQDGRCAICATETPGGNGIWHIDHDHSCCPGRKSCGRCIRGLLCNNCNVGIGYLKDNPVRLMAAAAYLTATSVA